MSTESTATNPDRLDDWFRRMGTGMSSADYEAGIEAIRAHDARIASEAAEGALRGFADTWRRGDSNPWALHVKTVVKRRADRLANEREGAGDE